MSLSKHRKYLFAAAFALAAIIFIIARSSSDEYHKLKRDISREFAGEAAGIWAEVMPGVNNMVDTDSPIVALTLDACGSSGDGYDSGLIDYLIANDIKATLFISGRWIDKNPAIFRKLAACPLFEIGNHGLRHKPCSVNGESAFGIKGTASPAEVVDEVELNARKIGRITGKKPKYYRSGTAFYDEAAVKIVNRLGYQVVGFSVIGDGGATFTRRQAKAAVSSAGPGSIIIVHMNHPEKEASKGAIEGIEELRKKGFVFAKLP
jgi:peptidoglycan/xylan/chitin deacetylase (PgdA/CDA1 family)